MRTIKFRGKVKRHDPMTNPENGWVEGYYFQDLALGEMRSYIFLPPCCWEVIPDTVGQLTGLLDKNGKEIYEGDIYRYTHPDSINEVSYCTGGGFAGFDLTPAIHSENRLLDVEVIGNIHDHPELLKTETL